MVIPISISLARSLPARAHAVYRCMRTVVAAQELPVSGMHAQPEAMSAQRPIGIVSRDTASTAREMIVVSGAWD
mgnify:CR=1 FL=1